MYNFNTVLYQFLETGTSDKTFMGDDQELKWLAFSLYPLSFFLYIPFNQINVHFVHTVPQSLISKILEGAGQLSGISNTWQFNKVHPPPTFLPFHCWLFVLASIKNLNLKNDNMTMQIFRRTSIKVTSLRGRSIQTNLPLVRTVLEKGFPDLKVSGGKNCLLFNMFFFYSCRFNFVQLGSINSILYI